MPKHKVKVNNSDVETLIDSGSTLNIIDEENFNKLAPVPTLTETCIKIYPYQANTSIPIKGFFHANVSSDKKSTTGKFYVTTGNAGTLLSKETAESVDLLRVGPPPIMTTANIHHQNGVPRSTQNVINKHKSLFEGTGLLKDFKLQLHIDPEITPVQQPIRRVPFHTRKKVEQELDRLLKLDIIEPVSGPMSGYETSK